MIDLRPNIPEVVAEVSELFERYEKALLEKYIEVMDATYWNSPYTIRFGPAEHGWVSIKSMLIGYAGRSASIPK